MLSGRSFTGRAAVLGAGTMGGGIAAQLANAGWTVELLDVRGPDSGSPSGPAAAGLARVIRNRPPLLFLPEYQELIRPGNIEDDLGRLAACEWIVEAVAEDLEVKRALLERVEAAAGPDSLISSNTSALGLSAMSAGRSEQFRARFFGTHFLNPPRYLQLLEVAALRDTDLNRFNGFIAFAEHALGHRTVQVHDTPGFISTRIWITHLLDTLHLAIELGISVEEVDYLTGALLGRPRSATFRMADLVGLDIVANVARNQYALLENDPYRQTLLIPDAMQRLLDAGSLGDKTGGGFYRKGTAGRLVWSLSGCEYRDEVPIRNVEIDSVARLPFDERMRRLASVDGKFGSFVAALTSSLYRYVDMIWPEIANSQADVDHVMEWGFGWQAGPFEIERLRSGAAAAPTVPGPQAAPQPGYDPLDDFRTITMAARAGRVVEQSDAASIIDLDCGLLGLEFHTKMNTFGPDLVSALDRARERAEQDFVALVIANDAANFSAGYNLNLFLAAAESHDWIGIDSRINTIQRAFRGLQCASVPVVSAVHGFTLGAGSECALHGTAVQAAPKSAIGQPEFNVGLIATGGGTTQLLARFMARWNGEGDAFPHVARVFELLTRATVSANAYEARKLGFLRATDGISRNAGMLLSDAARAARVLAEAGQQSAVPQSVWVTGPEGLARLRFVIHDRVRSGTWSDHDRLVADRYAWVLTGGDIGYAQFTTVERLLALEREAFLSLVGTSKTQARMRHTLASGKPLRN